MELFKNNYNTINIIEFIGQRPIFKRHCSIRIYKDIFKSYIGLNINLIESKNICDE